MRYRDYDGKLFALELLTAVTGTPVEEPGPGTSAGVAAPAPVPDKTVGQLLEQSPSSLANLFGDLDAALRGFGDDVQRTERKNYYAYKRLRNFACVEVHPRNHELLVYVKVDPDSVSIEDGFTRDVRNIGHFGTGGLEIRIRNHTDLERAGDLLLRSYQAS